MDNHCHAIGMEILTLDLMAHRCSLALLIVKAKMSRFIVDPET
ncbi:hypothetical protein [Photobacterium carnosum]|nr:hypothetical protein [Photobacterium carnosum]